jgi:hypothetical protein
MFQEQQHRRWEVLVVAAAVAVAAVSARPYAGAWNDGSRLATVECLVDHHTLAIDHSVFVRVPADGPIPYPAGDPLLRRHGTLDKLLIDGHFYSDKSPVPAVPLAGVYQAWQWCTGLTARAEPGRFCYVLTLASSGLSYVVAVWCVYRLGRRLHLPLAVVLALTASFALATVALPYARHVNNHILLLGVSAALMLNLAGLAEERHAWRLVVIGTLAGLGYSIDLGCGPVLLACTLVLVGWRCRGPLPVGLFLLAALPWLGLHHALNYATGGTLAPANAVPEYFRWEGCPFNEQNLTGGWKHDGVGRFLVYAAALLFGKHGFLGHNLPLLLALPAAVVLLRRRSAATPELLFAVAFCAGTWLMYAVNSNNYSGRCCSVRWFVPLLAPGYFVLAVFLQRHPRYLSDFLVLSGWGAVMGALMWWDGPWRTRLVPGFWLIVAAALLTWAAWAYRRRRRAMAPPAGAEPRHLADAA